MESSASRTLSQVARAFGAAPFWTPGEWSQSVVWHPAWNWVWAASAQSARSPWRTLFARPAIPTPGVEPSGLLVLHTGDSINRAWHRVW